MTPENQQKHTFWMVRRCDRPGTVKLLSLTSGGLPVLQYPQDRKLIR